MLIGREPELDEIDALLAAVGAGRGGVLVLTGEAGIGKSAILRAAAERASGFRVMRTDGVQYEAELPFSGLHELLHDVLELAAQLPSPQAAALRGALALSDEPAERFAVFAAIVSVLARTARELPVLVIADDAQWIDTASLEALGFAARRLSATPVGMLIGSRDAVPASFRADGFRHRELPGLSRDGIVTLLGRAVGRPLGHNFVERLAKASHGNPLALLEVAAAAAADERLAGRIGAGAPLPAGRLIAAALDRRLRQLSLPARRALVVVAAGEAESVHIILSALAHLEAPESVFTEAENAEAICVEGDRVRFRHPLLGSLAYGEAPAEERRRAHAALAACLADGPGAEGERRAWHLAAASLAPDEHVAATLTAAAQRFAQRSGHVAAAYA